MEIDNKTRAFNGFQAIKAGDPDFVNNTLIESFTDTLANMMHYAASQHQDFENALRIARDHFTAEVLGLDDYPNPESDALVRDVCGR